MADEAKTAKAEAKAAKARAKSLRPWFKKKRFWVLGIIAAFIVIAIISPDGDSTTSTEPTADSTNSATNNTVGSGLGTNDATADVKITDCGTPDAIGVTYPTVEVTNNSSKASTYFITLVAESQDGSVLYDNTIISIMSLQPNQSTTEKGMFTKEIPAGAVCKVTEVQRTAS